MAAVAAAALESPTILADFKVIPRGEILQALSSDMYHYFKLFYLILPQGVDVAQIPDITVAVARWQWCL